MSSAGIQIDREAGWPRLAFQGLLAICMLIPVTLPVPVLRVLVHERFGVSEFETSLFMSVNMLGAVLAAPLSGALADRWGQRRAILLWALLLDALCFFLLMSPVPFPVFMGIRFVEGAAHITALSMLLSIASTSVPSEHRGRALGIVGAGLLLGVALGAPIGGSLGHADPLRPLLAGGLLLLVTMAIAFSFLRDSDLRETTEEPVAGGLMLALRSEPRIVVPLLFAFADRFTVGFYTTTFSLFLSRVYDLGPKEIGFLIAAFMLPFALLSYPFGLLSERTSRVGLLAIGSLLYGLGTASLVLWTPTQLPIVMAAIGISAAVMFVPTMVLTTEYASDALRSTALSAFNAAGSLGFIVGPVTGGLISQSFGSDGEWLAGYRAAFGVAGGFEIALVFLALPFLRAGRRMRSRANH
ncbi:MAG: MFS transporter [Myxococcota bacterium]|nr:MFS transporter [Myxococcota bacterium]